MDKKVVLNRTLFEKEKYKKVVDVEFTTFLPPSTGSVLSIPEFFNAYEKLFYEIPPSGSINSHEYLVTRSSEFYKIDTMDQAIQQYLDEIALLRERLLEANAKIIDLQVENTVKSLSDV